ncbi:MAG TPA: GtrA family protein [Magnetospirillaceae bacterium]|nr:GtrA family protein [Magnetospirillaceae bacterium]
MLLNSRLARWLRDYTKRRRVFFTYAAIGVSGIVIDILLFALLVYLLHINPAVATIISTSFGITNNFLWNAAYNFKKKDGLWRRFFAFYGIGIAGIVASALIVLLLADIFAVDPLIVKLLSLPPVVIGQYFLNKRFSFGQKLPSVRRVGQFVKTHKLLFAVYIIFAALSVLSVKFTPYVPNSLGAPDEGQHYGKNVEFILDHHRLPVSGQDDIDSLSTCRDNPFGQATCLYSYQFTPAFSYVLSAMTAKIGNAVGLSSLNGARLASTLWGLVYITGVYLISRLFISYRWAVGLTAIAAFIPQVIFISSYVSDDIHSLALSTLLVYTSLAYIKFGQTKLRWWFYLSFGLLFLSKYNYFVLALVPAVLLVARWFHTKDWRPLIKDGGWMAVAALLLAGPWFLRNWLLYHDLMGMNFTLLEMSKYHAPGVRWSFLDPQSYLLLFRFDALNTLFESFFARFGYMYVRLGESYYTLLKLAAVAGLTALWAFGNRKVRQALGIAVGLVVLMICLITANAFIYDFQFQGRYLFSTIAVFVAVVAFALSQLKAAKRQNIAKGWLFGGLCVMAVVLLQSVLVVGTNLVGFYIK